MGQPHGGRPGPTDLDDPARAAAAMVVLIHQFAEMQARYRTALDGVHPGRRWRLAQTWDAAFGQLVRARYHPALTAAERAGTLTGERRRELAVETEAVMARYARLRTAVVAVTQPGGRASDAHPDVSIWWRELVLRHLAVLRAVNVALQGLRPERPAEAVALRMLGESWAEYLPEYEWLARRMPQGADRTRVPARLALRVWRACRLRDSLERRVVAAMTGPKEPGAGRSANSRLPTVDGRVTPADQAAADCSAVARFTVAAQRPPTRQITRVAGPHGIAWLPRLPRTNERPMDLYVWTDRSPELVLRDGLPTADIYLLAYCEPRRLAIRHGSGLLVRLHVPAATAVDLSEVERTVPATLQHRVREGPDVYLVPLGWLPRATITAVYDVDRSSAVTGVRSVPGASVRIRFVDADHGVSGLPNGVAWWPTQRSTTAERAYLMLPERPTATGAGDIVHLSWLPAWRDRPPIPARHRLCLVSIGRRRAIDVPTTLAQLAELSVAQPELSRFAGLDLVVPRREYTSTRVIEVYATGPRGRRLPNHPWAERTLAGILSVLADAG